MQQDGDMFKKMDSHQIYSKTFKLNAFLWLAVIHFCLMVEEKMKQWPVQDIGQVLELLVKMTVVAAWFAESIVIFSHVLSKNICLPKTSNIFVMNTFFLILGGSACQILWVSKKNLDETHSQKCLKKTWLEIFRKNSTKVSFLCCLDL